MTELRRLEMRSSILVNASPEAVWDVFSKAGEWPRWCDVCVEVSRAPSTWAMGDRLTMKLRLAGVAVPFDVHVVESSPGDRVAWESTKFTVTATRVFDFEHRDGGTLISDSKVFRSPLLPLRLFYPRWIIRAMTQSWLVDLKQEVERREG